MVHVLKSNIFETNSRMLRIHSIWPMKYLCEYTFTHMWLVYSLVEAIESFDFILVHWLNLLKWWITLYETSWRYIHWVFSSYNSFVNKIECEYMLLVILYVEYIYVVGDFICWVHICCWWLYMLNAYMLLVIIYVECIYVDGDYICCVHICCWWNLLHANCWWIVGVRMY